MKYMGSKSRIAKDIVPILQKCIDENNVDTYLECFCGGCNIIDKVKAKNRLASDKNKYLIALFKHLQEGNELLPEVPRELYSEVRANYKKGIYEDWYVGNIGFLASYNGRWFDGGYAKAGYEKTKTGERYRDYYREASDNIKKQIDNLKDVELKVADYRDIEPKSGSVIYCDPPYANTKEYENSTKFDYNEFWERMREWSKSCYVFISEENAPEDFVCIWEKSVSRSIKAGDKSKSTEKLFVYKDGLSNGKVGE